jgi:hypothetical protein
MCGNKLEHSLCADKGRIPLAARTEPPGYETGGEDGCGAPADTDDRTASRCAGS